MSIPYTVDLTCVTQVGGLLPDMHRINVALTRGRHKLIMIGSRDTLRHAPPLAKLFTVLSKHNMMLDMTKTCSPFTLY